MDPFHAAAVPYAKVEGLTAACNRCGIQPFRWQECFAPDLQQLDTNCTHELAEFEAHFGPTYVERLFSRYGLTFGGRAAITFRNRMPRRRAEAIAADAPPCAARLTNTSHFHIDFHGNYIPSLCTGLALDINHISSPVCPERYPILTTLHNEGVEGLLEQATSTYGFVPDPDGYVNNCDLCLAIRAHLVHTQAGHTQAGHTRDLEPTDFYDELFPQHPQ
jgi:hypothetical protein